MKKKQTSRARHAPSNAPRRFLGQLTPEQFLSRHWQRSPLLVRGAVPTLATGVTRRTLLDLAQRQDVEARLVSVEGDTWQLQHGPLERSQLAKLGKRDWTVLVSDLEQHVPTVAPLLEHLDFLPSWRVDDLMASFAVAGGSVGPHYDSYDVFLLQVHGQRRWQIAERFDRSQLRDDTPLCILSDFRVEHEWVLDPGDMLYLPPQVAHYGVAVDDAITFSLGCRVPSLKELATQFALQAIDRCAAPPLEARHPRIEHDRFSLDEIHSGDVAAALREVFRFDSDERLRGLGSLVSQPKALFSLDAESPPTAATVKKRLASEAGLRRRPGSRWLVVACSKHTYLYVDGQEYPCDDALDLARQLASGPVLHGPRLRRGRRSVGEQGLLQELVAAGQLLPLKR